jgi:hypothetical protein
LIFVCIYDLLVLMNLLMKWIEKLIHCSTYLVDEPEHEKQHVFNVIQKVGISIFILKFISFYFIIIVICDYQNYTCSVRYNYGNMLLKYTLLRWQCKIIPFTPTTKLHIWTNNIFETWTFDFQVHIWKMKIHVNHVNKSCQCVNMVYTNLPTTY